MGKKFVRVKNFNDLLVCLNFYAFFKKKNAEKNFEPG